MNGTAQASAAIPRDRGILAQHAETHEDTAARAEVLADKLGDIADRLLGPEPTSIKDGIAGPGAPAPGHFTNLYGIRNTRLALALDRIANATGRIAGAL